MFYIIPVLDTFGLLINHYFPFLIVFRSICFILSLSLVFRSRHINDSFKLILFLIILYLCITILFHLLIFQISATSEISGIVKLLYFPSTFLAFFHLLKDDKVNLAYIKRLIYRYGILLFLSLFIGYFSGYGGVVTGRGLSIEGSKGFMIGANEIGLMLVITIPILYLNFNYFSSKLLNNIFLLSFYLFSGVIVFTKSSLISSLMALWLFFLFVKKLKPISRYIIRFLMLIGFLFLTVFLRKNYNELIAFTNTTFFKTMLDGEVVKFLFRGREAYINAIAPILYDSSVNFLIFVFGAGEYYIRKVSEVPLGLDLGGGTLFEMDFFDLLAMFGVIGFILYTAILIMILKIARLGKSFFVSLIVILIFLHSFIAGHVLFSPQVTTLLSLILIYNLSNEKDFINFRNKA